MYLQQMGDMARITVSDTGIGILATEIPYLFAKFSRGKDPSRKVAATCNGAGRESKFIIELPLVQSEEILKKWG